MGFPAGSGVVLIMVHFLLQEKVFGRKTGDRVLIPCVRVCVYGMPVTSEKIPEHLA